MSPDKVIKAQLDSGDVPVAWRRNMRLLTVLLRVSQAP